MQATLDKMKELVKAGRVNPTIRSKALALTDHIPQKDRMGEIRALFDFVQNEIRYVRDIHDVETLHYAEQVMAQASGDCDDKTVLLASLLETIGHPARFMAVGFKPGEFSHVIVETQIFSPRLRKNVWFPLDATEPYPMGWRPPNIVEAMPWHI